MNILVIGGSKGLGHALIQGLHQEGRQFFIVSRTQPLVLQRNTTITATWIRADLTEQAFTHAIKEAIGTTAIDALIYNAGIWEENAFSDQYDFLKDDPLHISNIITTNLTAAILCVQSLLPNLSETAKIILIGSTSGIENNRSKEVAYQASKFGLRGLNNALRENLRKTKVTSTVINLGDLSTKIPYELGEKAVFDQIGYRLIPVHDVVKVVSCVIELSPAAYLKEIDMPGIWDSAV